MAMMYGMAVEDELNPGVLRKVTGMSIKDIEASLLKLKEMGIYREGEMKTEFLGEIKMSYKKEKAKREKKQIHAIFKDCLDLYDKVFKLWIIHKKSHVKINWEDAAVRGSLNLLINKTENLYNEYRDKPPTKKQLLTLFYSLIQFVINDDFWGEQIPYPGFVLKNFDALVVASRKKKGI